jgi:hypothetical protein
LVLLLPLLNMSDCTCLVLLLPLLNMS